ncbi:MAG: hypothetical protein D6791_17900 [Chloroflexi bacterium]|nr:MAG: hypothetical protein D6791_17900 [Chloroflexota bacterium]
MPKTNVRIDSVPEGTQAIVAEAASDLVARLGLDPETIRVTKLERIERLPAVTEVPVYGDLGHDSPPDYRIFFLAKGIQYIYETQQGKSPKLTERKFVV